MLSYNLDLVTDIGLATDYEPDEQVRNVLLTYLSQMTMCDEDGFGMRLPENLPEGFHLTHKRLSKRTLFTTDSGFAVILSRENTWRYVMGKEEYRESVSDSNSYLAKVISYLKCSGNFSYYYRVRSMTQPKIAKNVLIGILFY